MSGIFHWKLASYQQLISCSLLNPQFTLQKAEFSGEVSVPMADEGQPKTERRISNLIFTIFYSV